MPSTKHDKNVWEEWKLLEMDINWKKETLLRTRFTLWSLVEYFLLYTNCVIGVTHVQTKKSFFLPSRQTLVTSHDCVMGTCSDMLLDIHTVRNCYFCREMSGCVQVLDCPTQTLFYWRACQDFNNPVNMQAQFATLHVYTDINRVKCD